ncbi:19996_t:CDS:2 [Racocetra persica]|uniref:19996_t:CDS:1 n=1 Tax=Racocetra persica TaxID=160502 RepID=A0ACA9QLJ3_9GLOM|nr:19996_t:CDS:2 [Racocetra persica]
MATNKQNLLNQLDEFHRTLTPTLSSSNKDLFTNEFAKVKALANGIIELINLLKKVTTNQTNLEANIATQVQEREKELMVDLSQKFNERLAQEKAKITELSKRNHGRLGKRTWGLPKRARKSGIPKSQLERLRMKTASSQERQEILDKTRNNIEQKKAQLTAMTELINLDPEPQREEFSNDTEYSQALAA